MLKGVLYLFLFVACNSLQARTDFVFSILDTNDGLSENRIRTILQLEDGRMLFWTEGASNIYNGSGFTHIHLKGSDQMRLRGYDGFHHGYVEQDRVWMKHKGKLMLMDLSLERFVSPIDRIFASYGVTDTVIDFFVDAQKGSWILTSRDQLLHRKENQRAYEVFLPTVHAGRKPEDRLLDVSIDNQLVYLNYRSGDMHVYDSTNKQLLINTNPFVYTGKAPLNQTLMVLISGGFVYQIRNGNKGVCFVYDIRKKSWDTILETPFWLNTISADAHGMIWIGSKEGLWRFNPKSKQLDHHTQFKQKDGSSIESEISTQFHDEQGGFWIGTYNRGLMYYHPERFKISRYDSRDFGLSHPNFNVTGFVNHPRLGVLIATTHGMFTYAAVDKSIQPLTGILRTINAKQMLPRNDGSVWILTNDQVLFVLSESGVLSRPLFNERIRSICQTTDGTCFAATESGIGTLEMQQGKGLYVSWIQQKGIDRLYCFGDHPLVGVHDQSIFFLDIKKKSSTLLFEDSLMDGNQQYNTLYFDRENRLWIGTQDGLAVWLPSKNEIKWFFIEDGLINSSIKAIQQDASGRIWVSTSGGISCIEMLDPDTHFTRSITNYNHYDGLIGNEFVSNAMRLMDDRWMFVGGVHGFNVFDVNDVQRKKASNPLIISGFDLFGQRVQMDQKVDGEVLLRKAISTCKSIDLKHYQNFIGFEVAVLNYINPTQNEFRYKLEGIDADWRNVHSKKTAHVVTYTNLPWGNYSFLLSARNDQGAWEQQGVAVVLNIRPPWWRTPLAYFFYILIFVIFFLVGLSHVKKWNDKKLRQANEARLNQMKFEFFTNISHDIRTPLTLILAPLQSMRKEVLSDSIRTSLESTLKHANELKDMVDKLLDFRRLELSGDKLNLSFGSIEDLITSISESFKLFAAEKHISFEVVCALPNSLMQFDAIKLKSILNNLLTNAFKYTPEKGVVLLKVLEISDESAKKYIQIQVMDSGKGIEAKEIPFIFDQFHQASHSESGSGIGLYMVREYVHMHSGTIRVESKPKEGSIFTVCIPMYLDVDKENQPFVEKSNAGNGTFNHTILIVEDHQDMRSYLAKELGKKYHIVEASDGARGLEMANRALPDIVISDVMMPEMNGFELCSRLKSNLPTSHIPIVLLTARGTDELCKEGFKAGADAYIAKPFNLEVLLIRISNLLEQQDTRRKYFTQQLIVKPNEICIGSLDQELLEKAMSCVEQNMGRADFSVQQLSRELHMDRTVLYKKIHSLTALTPTEFIRSIRLKQAANLLLQGKYTVVEVAERVGFNTPRYFSTYFKQTFGQTPSEFVKSNNQSYIHSQQNVQ